MSLLSEGWGVYNLHETQKSTGGDIVGGGGGGVTSQQATGKLQSHLTESTIQRFILRISPS